MPRLRRLVPGAADFRLARIGAPDSAIFVRVSATTARDSPERNLCPLTHVAVSPRAILGQHTHTLLFLHRTTPFGISTA